MTALRPEVRAAAFRTYDDHGGGPTAAAAALRAATVAQAVPCGGFLYYTGFSREVCCKGCCNCFDIDFQKKVGFTWPSSMRC